ESAPLTSYWRPRPIAVLLAYWFSAAPLYGACLGCCAAMLLVRGGIPSGVVVLMRRRDIILLCLWLFPMPALFFALSQYTGHAMFIGRYLLFATPPFFLLLAWALSAFRTPLARVVILLS